jgi:hypothetical protein
MYLKLGDKPNGWDKDLALTLHHVEKLYRKTM